MYFSGLPGWWSNAVSAILTLYDDGAFWLQHDGSHRVYNLGDPMDISRVTIREGQTAPVDLDIRLDGVMVPKGDLDAMASLVAVITDKDNIPATSIGTVATITHDAYNVQYNPTGTDLLHAKSPYALRIRMTDGTGKIAYAPTDFPVRVRVELP